MVRRARTSDVRGLKSIIDGYVGRVLLAKELVTLYEDVQEFWVAELAGEVVGCGALHVLWEDIAELRTIAVLPSATGQGVGHALVDTLISVAKDLGLARLFVLTFETRFFAPRTRTSPCSGVPPRTTSTSCAGHAWSPSCGVTPTPPLAEPPGSLGAC